MTTRLDTVLISSAIGIVIGFSSAVWLFAIDVDVMAIPYSNQAVRTTRDVVVVQDSLHVKIPRGATVVHKFSPKGLPIYALEFVGSQNDHPITSPVRGKSYFYVEDNP